jgi:DNA-directed RNA polymerase specialized sigma24 family protein
VNLPQTPEPQPSDISPEISWTGLVEGIREGDPAAMEKLYQLFAKGVRFFLYRQLGPKDLEDKVHDVFLIVAQSIQKGDLREPERLMGYVRTVVRRQVAAHIEDAVQSRKNYTDLGRYFGFFRSSARSRARRDRTRKTRACHAHSQ